MVYIALPSVWVSDFPVPAPGLSVDLFCSEELCLQYNQSKFLWAIPYLHVHVNGKKML